MRDQYDDGRYDGGHRYAETSIGYLPITAVRGGIKYPSKGTPVAQSPTQKLAALKNKQENLAAEIANLERLLIRKAPPVEQAAWTIDVRFTSGGQLYNYLILRHNGVFYTTGTGSDGKFFSWTQVLAWLDTMASHSALLPLKVDYAQTAPLEGRNC